MQLRKYCVFLKEKHLLFRNVRSKMDILGISSDYETQILKKSSCELLELLEQDKAKSKWKGE